MSMTSESGTKILLAEDDNDMRRFLVKALQNAGFDVASFDNGLSAYHRLRGGRAQPRQQRAAPGENPVEALPPARPRQRGAEVDGGGLTA
jgi:CheY-like chemotaxis protein